MSYTHFTLDERKYQQKLLSEEKFREIAAILERNPSTISREVERSKAKYQPQRKTDNKY